MNSVPDKLKRDYDEHLDRFEACWRSGTAPDLREFFRLCPDRQYLVQLIAIDLEYRWKQYDPVHTDHSADRGDGLPSFPLVEHYVALAGPQKDGLLTPALIAEEYRARCRWGDHPTRSEYQTRFTDSSVELRTRLDYVDSELNGEFTVGDPHVESTVSFCEESIIARTRRQAEDGSGEFLPTDLELPQIGKYRPLQLIGRGGFSNVWLAEHPQLKQKVAIKVPRPDRRFSKAQLASFAREGQHLAALKRVPGIVNVLDVDECLGVPFIVSDYIEGQTLNQRLKIAPFPIGEAVALVAMLARALHQAHLSGLVHRDIKPSNVLLDLEGRAFLADFGLAATEHEQLRETPATLGTISYMSPEQARGEGHLVDGRSDIYSLGVILYQLLTRRLPFVAESTDDYVRQVQTKEPRPPRAVDESIPPELERICLKCLRKPINERYTTAGDLAADLEQWSRPATPRATKGILAATVVLIAAGLAYAAWGRGAGDGETNGANHAQANLSAGDGEPTNRNVVTPVAIIGGTGAANQVFGVNPATNSLQLSSDGTYLVRLGTLDEPNAVIRASIEQIGEGGEAGIFFGFRPHGDEGLCKFHLLYLKKELNGAVRAYHVIRVGPAKSPLFGNSYSRPRVDVHVFNPVNPVELTIDQRKLASVQWDRLTIREVPSKDPKIEELLADVTGEFGVFTSKASAVFSKIEVNGVRLNLR